MDALDLVERWPVDWVAAAVVGDEAVVTRGDVDRVVPLASLTKLATALAVLVAAEEGSVGLDEPVTGAGATVADLLAHAGGLAPESRDQLAPPRTRRIYSTSAYELVADHVATATGLDFATYLHEAVCVPLGAATLELRGSAGAGAVGSVRDMVALMGGWRRPGVVHAPTLERATTAHGADLAGVLPGFGRQDPNPWGLGPELRGTKRPHWTGADNTEGTFGHFGRSGTMWWYDPVAGRGTVALTETDFGRWATEAWPALSDAVLAEARR